MIKALGIISIVANWVCLSVLLTRIKKGASFSISQHAVASKRTYLTMAVIETVLLMLFSIFIIGWFSPHLQLPTIFTVIVLLAALGLVLAAWIPDETGIKHTIHELCAYGAFSLFIPATTILLVAPSASPATHIVAGVAMMYMVFNALTFSLIEKVKRYHLYFQVLYMALFHVVILLATYTK